MGKGNKQGGAISTTTITVSPSAAAGRAKGDAQPPPYTRLEDGSTEGDIGKQQDDQRHTEIDGNRGTGDMFLAGRLRSGAQGMGRRRWGRLSFHKLDGPDFDWYDYEKLLFYGIFMGGYKKYLSNPLNRAFAAGGAIVVASTIVPLALGLAVFMPLILLACRGRLPTPHGPYAVGSRVVEAVVDTAEGRNGVFATDGSDRRRKTRRLVRVRLWYPTPHPQRLSRQGGSWVWWWPWGKSLSGTWRRMGANATLWAEGKHDEIAEGYGKIMSLPLWYARYVLTPLLRTLRASSWEGGSADVVAGRGTLPLVVFSHGLCGTINTYSGLCVDLASRGRVVAAVEHKDGSAVVAGPTTDGHVVEYDEGPGTTGRDDADGFWSARLSQRTDEVAAAARAVAELSATPGDPLFERCPAGGAAAPFDVAGHSFGAATAATFAHVYPEAVRTVLMLDPWMVHVKDEVVRSALHPTAVVMTKSMTWDPNQKKAEEMLRAITENGACHDDIGGDAAATDANAPVVGDGGDSNGDGRLHSVLCEIAESRHQDMSDLPCLSYAPLRVLSMAGKQRPQETIAACAAVCDAFATAHGGHPIVEAGGDMPDLGRSRVGRPVNTLVSSSVTHPDSSPPSKSCWPAEAEAQLATSLGLGLHGQDSPSHGDGSVVTRIIVGKEQGEYCTSSFNSSGKP